MQGHGPRRSEYRFEEVPIEVLYENPKMYETPSTSEYYSSKGWEITKCIRDNLTLYKDKIKLQYLKCKTYLIELNKGYSQEIVLNKVDADTKKNIFKYIQDLNLNFSQKKESKNDTVVTIDVSPILEHKEILHDLLVFLENEKLKLERKGVKNGQNRSAAKFTSVTRDKCAGGLSHDSTDHDKKEHMDSSHSLPPLVVKISSEIIPRRNPNWQSALNPSFDQINPNKNDSKHQDISFTTKPHSNLIVNFCKSKHHDTNKINTASQPLSAKPQNRIFKNIPEGGDATFDNTCNDWYLERTKMFNEKADEKNEEIKGSINQDIHSEQGDAITDISRGHNRWYKKSEVNYKTDQEPIIGRVATGKTKGKLFRIRFKQLFGKLLNKNTKNEKNKKENFLLTLVHDKCSEITGMENQRQIKTDDHVLDVPKCNSTVKSDKKKSIACHELKSGSEDLNPVMETVDKLQTQFIGSISCVQDDCFLIVPSLCNKNSVLSKMHSVFCNPDTERDSNITELYKQIESTKSTYTTSGSYFPESVSKWTLSTSNNSYLTLPSNAPETNPPDYRVVASFRTENSSSNMIFRKSRRMYFCSDCQKKRTVPFKKRSLKTRTRYQNENRIGPILEHCTKELQKQRYELDELKVMMKDCLTLCSTSKKYDFGPHT